MARKSAKPAVRKTVRLTIDIDVELDCRLYAIAKRRGRGKGELAAQLMEQSIRRYKDEASDGAEEAVEPDARVKVAG